MSLPLFLSVSVSLYLSLSVCLCLSLSPSLPQATTISQTSFPCSAFTDSAPTMQCLNSSLEHFTSIAVWGPWSLIQVDSATDQSKAPPLLGKFVVDAGNTAGGRLPGFLASSPLQGGVEPPPNCCDSTAARTGLGWSRPLQPTLSSARLRLCSGQGCPTTRWF